MADLTERDRGQIILVAAFALAVIFVAMALIVNSAIFTENLASRSETAGSEGALSMRAMVETNVGYALDAVNQQTGITDDELRDNVNNSAENISIQTGRQEAGNGRLVNISSVISSQDGWRIEQTAVDNFTSDSNNPNYELIGGVSRVSEGNGTRAFRINATNITANGNGTAFAIIVNETGATGNENTWRAQIWNESGTIHVRTLRADSSGTFNQSDCEVTLPSKNSTIQLDVTEGTINAEPCDALGTNSTGANYHFGSGTGVQPGDPAQTYDINFANATTINGTFSLTVHNDTDLDTDGLDSAPSASNPTGSNALYNVTVRYTYTTSDLQYETDIRVAPGEPDV